ncbi:MAG: ATP synthase subunit I [Megasphaera sp.]|jgi:hypothetical protein|nr:ATP synthase subunit I [Megasphaera sp.]MCH4187468.1 ATP synthase subunit I [Megasphaera sp.]MCH4217387.1 ATP synthase subunit I [Megasphaera sp.]
MKEFTTYVKATIIKLFSFTCIGISLLIITGGWRYITGWCTGCAVNLVYFAMLSSRSLRALHLPLEQAVAFIRSGVVLRFLLICLVLILILQFPFIHFGAAVAGILSYRVLIIADTLFKAIRSRRRKEV